MIAIKGREAEIYKLMEKVFLWNWEREIYKKKQYLISWLGCLLVLQPALY